MQHQSEAGPGDTQIKIMAGIGAVCVQWAVLEQMVLGVIATVEDQRLERVYLMFGGLDLRPRLNMAIALASDRNIPSPIISRLKSIRSALGKPENLADKRNQAVHGLHADAGIPDSVRLTMARWGEPRRHEIITTRDLYDLQARLRELWIEAHDLQEAIFSWKLAAAEKERARLQVIIEENSSVFTKATRAIVAAGRRLFRRS